MGTKINLIVAKVMRKQPKMSANAVSGLLAYNMELHILYKIGVVAAPMVRSVPRYKAFPNRFLDWYSRLVGFGGKFKFKFWDSMIPITYIKEATLLPKWVN